MTQHGVLLNCWMSFDSKRTGVERYTIGRGTWKFHSRSSCYSDASLVSNGELIFFIYQTHLHSWDGVMWYFNRNTYDLPLRIVFPTRREGSTFAVLVAGDIVRRPADDSASWSLLYEILNVKLQLNSWSHITNSLQTVRLSYENKSTTLSTH